MLNKKKFFFVLLHLKEKPKINTNKKWAIHFSNALMNKLFKAKKLVKNKPVITTL